MINSARSALSSVAEYNGKPLGQDPTICRFMTGVLNLRPQLPRYVATWDLNIVLDFFRAQGDPLDLDYRSLALRLAMILCLTTGRRGQSILFMDVDHMRLRHDSATFFLQKPVKTYSKSSLGDKSQQIVKVKAYPANLKICPVHTLEVYLDRMSSLRTSSQLLVSYIKPHGAISRSTLSRWVLTSMDEAGINTKVYKSHSTRSASVSKVFHKGLRVPQIIEAAGWRSDNCFAKYYLRDIESQYQEVVLD